MEVERVVTIRADAQTAAQIIKMLGKYDGVEVDNPTIDTETRTSTILPMIRTNKRTVYGEHQIGAWLSGVKMKGECTFDAMTRLKEEFKFPGVLNLHFDYDHVHAKIVHRFEAVDFDPLTTEQALILYANELTNWMIVQGFAFSVAALPIFSSVPGPSAEFKYQSVYPPEPTCGCLAYYRGQGVPRAITIIHAAEKALQALKKTTQEA